MLLRVGNRLSSVVRSAYISYGNTRFFSSLDPSKVSEIDYLSEIESINNELTSFFGTLDASPESCSPNPPSKRESQACLTRKDMPRPMSSFASPKATHTEAVEADINASGPVASGTYQNTVATARLALDPVAFHSLQAATNGLEDALSLARFAGIMGAKQAAQLLPLCQSKPLTKVNVQCKLEASSQSVLIEACVSSTPELDTQTEAMMAACVASLAIYDAVKHISSSVALKDMHVSSTAYRFDMSSENWEEVAVL